MCFLIADTPNHGDSTSFSYAHKNITSQQSRNQLPYPPYTYNFQNSDIDSESQYETYESNLTQPIFKISSSNESNQTQSIFKISSSNELNQTQSIFKESNQKPAIFKISSSNGSNQKPTIFKISAQNATSMPSSYVQATQHFHENYLFNALGETEKCLGDDKRPESLTSNQYIQEFSIFPFNQKYGEEENQIEFRKQEHVSFYPESEIIDNLIISPSFHDLNSNLQNNIDYSYFINQPHYNFTFDQNMDQYAKSTSIQNQKNDYNQGYSSYGQSQHFLSMNQLTEYEENRILLDQDVNLTEKNEFNNFIINTQYEQTQTPQTQEQSLHLEEGSNSIIKRIMNSNKKNVVKNIMSAFKRYIQQIQSDSTTQDSQMSHHEETLSKIHHLKGNKESEGNFAIQNILVEREIVLQIYNQTKTKSESIEEMGKKFKRYISSKQFNHYTIRLLVQHSNYGQLFQYFLETHALNWLTNSKVDDPNSHRIMIEFLLVAFEDIDIIEKLKRHEKRKAIYQ